MKNSVILLGSLLVLGFTSCKSKKQTTSSGSSTTSTTTNSNQNLNVATESGNTTVSETSNPKKSTELETSVPGKNPKSGAIESENTNVISEPKKGSGDQTTTTGPTKNISTKNTSTSSENVSVQPTVYEGVTDQSCAVEVSFGSPGSGIDGPAFDKVLALIDSKKVAYTSKTIGREGERRLCMPLTELKENDKKDFINQLKKIAKEGQYVSLSIR
ncbi:MAG: hypothetical protein ABIP51_06360 [Bacteroidia bacterium]